MATKNGDNKNLLPDRQLFLAIANGSHEAFSQFFDSYKKRIYGFLYKKLRSHEVVEELLQIVFVKVWENRATINPDLSPDAYVLKIAKNSALNFLRQKAYKLLLEKQLIEKINVAEDGETSLVDEDLKRHIDDLVAHIPERRREIFRLRYEKDLSYKEIAEKLSISESTVNTQISLALNYLRKELGRELWAVIFPLITFFSILKI